jgi:hypothetical protein
VWDPELNEREKFYWFVSVAFGIGVMIVIASWHFYVPQAAWMADYVGVGILAGVIIILVRLWSQHKPRLVFLERYIPRFLFPEVLALLSCGIGSILLFAFSWVFYGFDRSWPVLGLTVGVVVGVAGIAKLGNMTMRGETDWKYVNRTCFHILLLSVALMFGLAFISPLATYLVVPAFLYGLWHLDYPASSNRAIRDLEKAPKRQKAVLA